MRSAVRARTWAALALALVLPALSGGTLFLLSGCRYEQRYTVRGRVVGFGDDARTIVVEHEAVEHLMPAMTMPFTLARGETHASLDAGDAVRFTLVMARDSTWIQDLERLPDDEGARHPAGATVPAEPAPAGRLLRPGDLVPPIRLIDQDGAPFTLNDYRGRALLLTFVYTRCPLPDFCPRLSGQFKVIEGRLKEQAGDRARLLSISFDPAHDTPAVLAAYARRYTQDAAYWRFATGAPGEITRATSLFGVAYRGEGPTLDHNLATALVGPDGRVHTIWRGNEWTPEEAVAAVLAALGGA
jgi:protein SCO1/2